MGWVFNLTATENFQFVCDTQTETHSYLRRVARSASKQVTYPNPIGISLAVSEENDQPPIGGPVGVPHWGC